MAKSEGNLVEELASLQLMNGTTLNAYLMCRNGMARKYKELLINKMIGIVEENGWPSVPIILSTTLRGGGEFVRELLVSQEDRAAEKIQKVIDGTEGVFVAIFGLASDCDDCKKLMELH